MDPEHPPPLRAPLTVRQGAGFVVGLLAIRRSGARILASVRRTGHLGNNEPTVGARRTFPCHRGSSSASAARSQVSPVRGPSTAPVPREIRPWTPDQPSSEGLRASIWLRRNA